MQLRYDQLDKHLQNELAPVYLVSGEIPLLMQETSDAIRKASMRAGYIEREILAVETGFNWQNFFTATQTLCLFSSKQLLELRIQNSLSETNGKIIQSYLAHPSPDKILLITTGKLDTKAQKSTWFQAINKIGIIVQLWPIESTQLFDWIAQRLKKAELETDRAGIQLLAECAEGNLLACAQEIEKLKLIYTQGYLSPETIAEAIGNSTRFDVFNLVDAALQGESKRLLAILHGLKTEGLEPILILWALARELRSLSSMAYELSQNISIEKILQSHYVWEKRKPLVRRALKIHSTKVLRQLLQQAQHIDCIIKGLAQGNVWDELENLSLVLSGITSCINLHTVETT